MIKNILVFVLIIVALLLWTRVEPEDDSNLVNMEYDCSTLEEYETVPPEVMEECTKRLELGLIKSSK